MTYLRLLRRQRIQIWAAVAVAEDRVRHARCCAHDLAPQPRHGWSVLRECQQVVYLRGEHAPRMRTVIEVGGKAQIGYGHVFWRVIAPDTDMAECAAVYVENRGDELVRAWSGLAFDRPPVWFDASPSWDTLAALVAGVRMAKYDQDPERAGAVAQSLLHALALWGLQPPYHAACEGLSEVLGLGVLDGIAVHHCPIRVDTAAFGGYCEAMSRVRHRLIRLHGSFGDLESPLWLTTLSVLYPYAFAFARLEPVWWDRYVEMLDAAGGNLPGPKVPRPLTSPHLRIHLASPGAS